MEKDVNLIIDVEPEEAQLLIELIAEKKKAERKGGPTDPAAS
ncbi:MAG TPA: hypothetical protein VN857_11450 [Chthoniobacterales bacterium]|jgi:hypothetical protein|nr:hypothetical protein [Chthoniobacterales bacterium]